MDAIGNIHQHELDPNLQIEGTACLYSDNRAYVQFSLGVARPNAWISHQKARLTEWLRIYKLNMPPSYLNFLYLKSKMFLIFALCLGALSHIAYFAHGEHHMYGMLYLHILACVLLVITLVLWLLQGQAFATSLYTSATIESQFLAGLFSSIVAYRLSPTHQLHAYSGPLSWRISKLTHAWSNRNFENFRNLYAVHEEYGDYVRTGPLELSIIDPEVVTAVLGPKSRCTRAAWYEMAHPIRAIFHTRSKAEHEKRRKVWSSGLSSRALKAYQPRIEFNIASLVQQIEKKCAKKKTTNVSRWFNFFSFDVMGDVGFGRNFGMLESGEKLEVLKKLEDGQKGLGVFGVVPWLFMILTRIPWIRKEHNVFVKWCKKQIMDRGEVSDSG